MKNPFEFGTIISSESFCSRKRELLEVTRTMESAGNLFIYSERRFGKSSLVKLALQSLPKKRFITVYIDLWITESAASFMTTVAKGMTNAIAKTQSQILETAKSMFGFLVPAITLDDEGKPILTFGVSRNKAMQKDVEEILKAPLKIAEKTGKTVVVVFDEFQQILEYDDGKIEKMLRSVIQQ